MMRELRLVLGLELHGLYGINAFRHTKDPRTKRNGWLMIVAWSILIAMVLFYVSGLSYALCIAGLSSILPTYLGTVASLLVFAFGFFRSAAILFSQKSHDMLCSLPISPFGILIGRFASLYLQDLLFTLLIFLPGSIVCIIMTAPAFPFYLTLLVGIPLLPMLPLTLSVAIGSFVAAIASRMKHKTAAQILLTLLLVVAVLLLSFKSGSFAEEMTPEAMIQLADQIGTRLAKLYPPAAWFGLAAGGKLWYLLLLAAASLLPTIGMLAILSRFFTSISARLFSSSASHNYQLEELKADKLMSALIRREFKRYFSSVIYVTNTIIGPIMGCILAGSLLFWDLTPIQAMLPQVDIRTFIPFLFAAVFSMMTITSVSISMEGKQLWISQTLPISTKAWLDAKLAMNLLLYLPFYLISEILMVIALRPDFGELIWFLLVPVAILLFVTVFGTFINLHLHRFDWSQETQIVKQSASAAIGGFIGFFLSLLLALPLLVTPAAYGHLVRAVILLFITAATYLLYRSNLRADLSRL